MTDAKHKPPADLGSNLGLAQQCWHMAHAACDALGIPFSETSPNEITNHIELLKRDSITPDMITAMRITSMRAGERSALCEIARALRERAGAAFADGNDERARDFRELAAEWHGRAAAADSVLNDAHRAEAELRKK